MFSKVYNANDPWLKEVSPEEARRSEADYCGLGGIDEWFDGAEIGPNFVHVVSFGEGSASSPKNMEKDPNLSDEISLNQRTSAATGCGGQAPVVSNSSLVDERVVKEGTKPANSGAEVGPGLDDKAS